MESFEMSDKGYGEYRDNDGTTFASCTSGRYRIADIMDFLRGQVEDGDTMVTFEVLTDGELRIATTQGDGAYIEASGFEEV